MTDKQDAPDTITDTDVSTDEPTDQEAPPEAPESAQDDRPANREAKYRIRLRETEAQRDALQERVTTMQRQAAEGIAAELLDKAAALWAVTDLQGLLDEQGDLDPAKVTEAANRAISELGASAPRVSLDFGQGRRRDRQTGPGGDGWTRAFAP